MMTNNAALRAQRAATFDALTAALRALSEGQPIDERALEVAVADYNLTTARWRLGRKGIVAVATA
jgi:hypothetical protein